MKIGVGFITYNNSTAKYLPYFWPSLEKALAFLNNDCEAKIWIADNSDTQDNANYLFFVDQPNSTSREFFWNGSNLGFSKAYNKMIDRAVKWGADYFLMINPDTILNEDSLMILIKSMLDNPSLAVVSPRIFRWDFENNQPTEVIDSDGLAISPEHHFSDWHQGMTMVNQGVSKIFGFTGAAALLRVKALQEVSFKRPDGRQEYLDELMFMYKEDIDLSYRLFLVGWETILNPAALIYHDRTATANGESWLALVKNRRHKNKSVRRWSFTNHWILILRYAKRELPFWMRWPIWRYQLLSTLYVLFFEPYLLSSFRYLWQSRLELKFKKNQIKRNVSAEELNKIMISQ